MMSGMGIETSAVIKGEAMMSLIDSHVHLDHILAGQSGRIDWLRAHHCAVVSWAWCREPESVKDLRDYLGQKQRTIHALHRQGLSCCYLAGIHPRNITHDLTAEAVVDLVAPHLEDPLCRGIGEIGLEYGSARETEILAAHLSLAADVRAAGKKIGIHTPRGNKVAVTETLLAFLATVPEIKPLSVIDHCSATTLPPVLAGGYRAGITLSPIKTDWRTLPVLTERHGKDLDRIMCNTDSGTRFYEDLVTASREARIEPHAARQIFHDNAALFFGMK